MSWFAPDARMNAQGDPAIGPDPRPVNPVLVGSLYFGALGLQRPIPAAQFERGGGPVDTAMLRPGDNRRHGSAEPHGRVRRPRLLVGTQVSHAPGRWLLLLGGSSSFLAWSRRCTAIVGSRLEVIASPDNPSLSRALGEPEYQRLVGLLEHHYSIILVDCGIGILDSATCGIVDIADQLVVVTGPSVDSARATCYLLDWLESHGLSALVAGAVAVINAVPQKWRTTSGSGAAAWCASPGTSTWPPARGLRSTSAAARPATPTPSWPRPWPKGSHHRHEGSPRNDKAPRASQVQSRRQPASWRTGPAEPYERHRRLGACPVLCRALGKRGGVGAGVELAELPVHRRRQERRHHRRPRRAPHPRRTRDHKLLLQCRWQRRIASGSTPLATL